MGHSKKSKVTGGDKTIYLICAASKSTIYVWCFDPVKQHQADGNCLEAVVEISIADGVADGKSDELDSSLSWIRHVQFLNSTHLMILRGSQSISVQKQLQFVSEDDDFVGKVVLENVTASF